MFVLTFSTVALSALIVGLIKTGSRLIELRRGPF